MKTLQKFFNIKSGEGIPVIILAAYYFCIMAASVTGRSVSSALFLSRITNGEVLLPLLLIPVAITAALTVAVYTRLAKRVALVPLLTITGVFFAITLVMLMPLLSQTWALIVFYIWMEVINNIIFFQFYIFAATIFDTRQAKRIFGVLPVGGALATILGGLALAPFTQAFGSPAVLIFAAAFILLSVATVWRARPYMKQAQTGKLSDPAEKQEPVKLDGYLRTIIIVIAATILVATIADYQYKLIANHTFSNNDVGLTAFFGQVSALLGLLQLFLRLFVVGKLLTRFGILAGLIILPIAVGINSIAVLLTPNLLTGALLRISDAAIRFTLNETSMELLWVPVSPQRKLAFRPFVSATIPSIMQSIAGLLSFLVVTVVSDFDTRVIIIGVMLLAIVGVWIPMTFRLRKGYVAELMSSIQQRQLALEDLDLDETDATTIATIDRSLNSPDEVEQAFTLGMIENRPLTPWAKTLTRLFHEGSFLIRQKIMDIAATYPDIITSEELHYLIDGEPKDLTDEAIIAAGKRNMTEIIPALERHLADTTPEVRAAAAWGILTMGRGPINRAQDTLRDMLEGPVAEENVIALRTLSTLPTSVSSAVVHESMLRDMLNRQSTRARRVVLEMVVNPGYWAKEKPADNETLVSIAYNLRKPATAPVAENVLKNYPTEHVIEVLTTLLRDKGSPLPLKQGIIQALRNYPTRPVIDQLIKLLDLNNRILYAEAVHTLLLIARQEALPADVLAQIDDQTMDLARIVYTYYQLIDLIGPDEPLMSEVISNDIQETLPALLKLSVMDVPDTQIESIIEQVKSPQSANIGNVLEIMENVLSKNERDVIIPLFELPVVGEIARMGQRYFGHLPDNLDGEILGYIVSQDEWRSLVALDFVLRNHRQSVISQVNWNRVPDSPANRELVSRYLSQNGGGLREKIPQLRFPIFTRTDKMYSTLEKTIMLKSVVLFKNIDAREIFHIAQITDEEHLQADQALFHEGDSGDCLYIVVKGRLRIHKGNQELIIFQKGDALGEMALFDNLPRSASATALEETSVLKIQQDKFYELMASRMEIMQSIVKMLSLRLRAATQQVSDLMSQNAQ
jgi:CRP-like cAMP-binding protein